MSRVGSPSLSAISRIASIVVYPLLRSIRYCWPAVAWSVSLTTMFSRTRKSEGACLSTGPCSMSSPLWCHDDFRAQRAKRPRQVGVATCQVMGPVDPRRAGYGEGGKQQYRRGAQIGCEQALSGPSRRAGTVNVQYVVPAPHSRTESAEARQVAKPVAPHGLCDAGWPAGVCRE